MNLFRPESERDLPLASPGVEAEGRRNRIRARPILIVDDDPGSRLVTALCIAEIGLTNPTMEVADGRHAIAEMQRCIDDGPGALPVMVLLDLQMPACSGLDVARWMRKTPELATVPVIVLTGDDDAGSVISLYGLGVRSYLVKPVGFAALASVVRDLELPWMLT